MPAFLAFALCCALPDEPRILPQFPPHSVCMAVSDHQWKVKHLLDDALFVYGGWDRERLIPLRDYAERTSWAWYRAALCQREGADWWHLDALVGQIGEDAYQRGELPFPLLWGR